LGRESSKVAAADWPKANAILPPSLRKILQVSYKDHNITSEEILHEKASRDCDWLQIPYGWAHATFTSTPASQSCNYMDSSTWQVKKVMPEDDIVQKIPERLGVGQDHMGGS